MGCLAFAPAPNPLYLSSALTCFPGTVLTCPERWSGSLVAAALALAAEEEFEFEFESFHLDVDVNDGLVDSFPSALFFSIVVLFVFVEPSSFLSASSSAVDDGSNRNGPE